MERITEKQLQAVVDRMNAVTDSPAASYTKNGRGKLKANVGNYHLEFAYNRVGLSRMVNEGGGVETIFNGGTKRELYDQLHAFLKGFSTQRMR